MKLVAFDVDGVLTDGGVHIGAVNGAPIEFKRFDIQDGLGIKFLQWSGLKVVIISGRMSEATRLRAEELGVDDCTQDNQAHKLKALEAMCAKWKIPLIECAMVGDDWPDMAVLQKVGLPVAVANAVPEVRQAAVVRLDRAGGNGAVREFADWLHTQGIAFGGT
ncbi:MAG: HAD hydrolase family protein [Gemmatimonadetes bacterium]|nr:HAD hydrolase family protein [Gemmatimonadota bacterium]